MKILHEFVPTRKFLRMAEEIKDLVDGWNITDSAAGRPAPSGTAVGCILKTKYPDKMVIPIFVLRYKGPVEAGGLALAGDAVGLDGIVLTMGDPQKLWMFGHLLIVTRSVDGAIAHVRDAWDFFFFMRLEEKSLPMLRQIADECKRLGKPIYAYFVVGTPRNAEIIKMIGWPVTATMENAVEFAEGLEDVVDGIIATCVGDYEGDKELLRRLQKFR